MRADEFRDEGVKVPDERSRSFVVVSKRSRHQCGDVEIVNHAHHNVSTLSYMTGRRARRLQRFPSFPDFRFA